MTKPIRHALYILFLFKKESNYILSTSGKKYNANNACNVEFTRGWHSDMARRAMRYPLLHRRMFPSRKKHPLFFPLLSAMSKHFLLHHIQKISRVLMMINVMTMMLAYYTLRVCDEALLESLSHLMITTAWRRDERCGALIFVLFENILNRKCSHFSSRHESTRLTVRVAFNV